MTPPCSVGLVGRHAIHREDAGSRTCCGSALKNTHKPWSRGEAELALQAKLRRSVGEASREEPVIAHRAAKRGYLRCGIRCGSSGKPSVCPDHDGESSLLYGGAVHEPVRTRIGPLESGPLPDVRAAAATRHQPESDTSRHPGNTAYAHSHSHLRVALFYAAKDALSSFLLTSVLIRH